MVSMKPQHQEGNAHLAFYFMGKAITVISFPYHLKAYGVRSRESSQALSLVQ